jgi:hypothetical protein
MSKTINLLMFIFGAAVGSIVTWQYTKQIYEKITQEEIDSVKEVFSRKEGADVSEKAAPINEKPSIAEYAKRLQNEGYTNYSNQEEKSETMSDSKPYVIPPEEFGEADGYEKISFTYYSDSILADENDEIVEDVEEVVGIESLGSFGEYEDDSVFVRNDRLKCDYEILLDMRRYSDVVKRK